MVFSSLNIQYKRIEISSINSLGKIKFKQSTVHREHFHVVCNFLLCRFQKNFSSMDDKQWKRYENPDGDGNKVAVYSHRKSSVIIDKR